MNTRFRPETALLLPAAALTYVGSWREIAAILLPVFFHEIGHVLALRMLGLHIRRFRAELRGFCIEYYGECSAVGHALAAAAGPASGLLWAFGASLLGQRQDWLYLSSGVSLLLSVFNLLPALPLDGGRILLTLACACFGDRRGEKLAECCGLAVGAMMLAGGILLMLHGKGVAPLTASIWLLGCQGSARGLANRPEMI